MKKLKNILHSKKFIICLVTFLLIYSIIIFNIPRVSKYNGNETEFICTIININKNDYYKLDLFCKEKIIGYYFNDTDIKIGDIIKINGSLEDIDSYNNFNIFNYKNYLNNKGIYYKLNINNITLLKREFNIYTIKNIIIERVSNLKSYPYISSLLLGNKEYLDKEEKDNYQKIGIIHIFAISGMHLSIIITSIKKVLKKDNILRDIVILIIIFLYYLLIDSISLLRAALYYLISLLNIKLKLELNVYHRIFYLLIIITFINPYNLINMSFLYSYIISSALILLGNKINKITNYFLKLLYVSFVSSVIAFPLNTYNYYEVNVMSIFFNLIAIPMVTFIIYPMSFLTLLFPVLDNFYFFIINIFNNIVSFLSTRCINIIFKKSLLFVIIYYLLFILIVKYKKIVIILLLTIIIHLNYNYIFTSRYIAFLDVGQGDSILIHNRNDNILIDTGGNIKYDLSSNILIPVFKSNGITNINTLVITHGDFDHMGEAINLVNNFKVEKVIFNCGPYNELEKELIKVLDKKHINYYSCIKELIIDNNKLYFLQTKEYGNENDNSNVIYTELNGYKFMFMGDASTTTEKEILSKYNLLNIDVLKVGHHGSKTSSSKDFIDDINPKYSVISVGKNNSYGHPNKEVLDNLDNSKVYRTDQDGSTMFKIKSNNLRIETYVP